MCTSRLPLIHAILAEPEEWGRLTFRKGAHANTWWCCFIFLGAYSLYHWLWLLFWRFVQFWDNMLGAGVIHGINSVQVQVLGIGAIGTQPMKCLFPFPLWWVMSNVFLTPTAKNIPLAIDVLFNIPIDVFLPHRRLKRNVARWVTRIGGAPEANFGIIC